MAGIEKPARDRPGPHRRRARDDPRRHLKGAYGAITFAAEDLDTLYEPLEAAGAEVVQEPTDQDYGVRDCAFRDPSGNLVRITSCNRVCLAAAAMAESRHDQPRASCLGMGVKNAPFETLKRRSKRRILDTYGLDLRCERGQVKT